MIADTLELSDLPWWVWIIFAVVFVSGVMWFCSGFRGVDHGGDG